LTFSESTAVEHETVWTASENRPNLRNQRFISVKNNNNISIYKKKITFLREKISASETSIRMEGGRRAATAAAANQSNFTSGIEIDSVDSTSSINQSISQSMVYEDKEMVNKLTIMNQRETIPIEIPFRVQRKGR